MAEDDATGGTRPAQARLLRAGAAHRHETKEMVLSNAFKVESRGAVRVITMDRPPVNAIDVPLLEDMQRTLEKLEADDEVGAIVLTGAGKCFSAGLDLKKFSESSPEQMRELLLALNRSFLALFSFPRPVVAAVNGHAIAGGMMVAMCCDYRVAPREKCKLGLTEVRVGVNFPIAGLEIARTVLDTPTVQYLAQVGRNIDSDEALRRGVVTELQDTGAVFERAVAVAEDLATIPRMAYAATKQQICGDAIARIQPWVDADDDPAMSVWMDPTTTQYAKHILDGTRAT